MYIPDCLDAAGIFFFSFVSADQVTRDCVYFIYGGKGDGGKTIVYLTLTCTCSFPSSQSLSDSLAGDAHTHTHSGKERKE